MHKLTIHSIIPFDVGGRVDLYPFPTAIEGTVYATMELIEPDGTGPRPSKIGTYELVAATKKRIVDETQPKLGNVEDRIGFILTRVGGLAFHDILNPGDTCEIPDAPGKENRSVLFDEWPVGKGRLRIGVRRHGLLLCIEVFRSELEFALDKGSRSLLKRLKERGYYPYSDLDRAPVA